jgi:lipid-A-disaccharide synthase
VVVAYRSSYSTYAVARRVLTVRWISLVNLIAGRSVVPEFWHLPVREEEVGNALRPLLESSTPEHQAQLAGLAQVRCELGQPGAAMRVASMVLERISG